MRQVKVLALMIALALLTGCAAGNGGKETVLAMRTKLLQQESIKLCADIRADYGERVYNFSVEYEGGAGSGTVTVTSPEEIAGVTARFSADASTLEYDGASFDTGNIMRDISPMSALPILLEQWMEGYVKAWGTEKLDGVKALVIMTDISDTVLMRAWFDMQTLEPIHAEISENGYTRIYCDFTAEA